MDPVKQIPRPAQFMSSNWDSMWSWCRIWAFDLTFLRHGLSNIFLFVFLCGLYLIYIYLMFCILVRLCRLLHWKISPWGGERHWVFLSCNLTARKADILYAIIHPFYVCLSISLWSSFRKNYICLLGEYDADQNLPSDADTGKGDRKGISSFNSFSYCWLFCHIGLRVTCTDQSLISVLISKRYGTQKKLSDNIFFRKDLSAGTG